MDTHLDPYKTTSEILYPSHNLNRDLTCWWRYGNRPLHLKTMDLITHPYIDIECIVLIDETYWRLI